MGTRSVVLLATIGLVARAAALIPIATAHVSNANRVCARRAPAHLTSLQMQLGRGNGKGKAENSADQAKSPSKIFEEALAPLYIPPAVAQSRPELVKLYKAAPGKKRPAQQPKAGVKAKPAAKPTPAAKQQRTRVTPSQSSSKGESPSQVFERTLAPFFIPPAVAKARPQLVKLYQGEQKKTKTAKPSPVISKRKPAASTTTAPKRPTARKTKSTVDVSSAGRTEWRPAWKDVPALTEAQKRPARPRQPKAIVKAKPAAKPKPVISKPARRASNPTTSRTSKNSWNPGWKQDMDNRLAADAKKAKLAVKRPTPSPRALQASKKESELEYRKRISNDPTYRPRASPGATATKVSPAGAASSATQLKSRKPPAPRDVPLEQKQSAGVGPALGGAAVLALLFSAASEIASTPAPPPEPVGPPLVPLVAGTAVLGAAVSAFLSGSSNDEADKPPSSTSPTTPTPTPIPANEDQPAVVAADPQLTSTEAVDGNIKPTGNVAASAATVDQDEISPLLGP